VGWSRGLAEQLSDGRERDSPLTAEADRAKVAAPDELAHRAVTEAKAARGLVEGHGEQVL
jgi:phage shock protein A